MNLNTEQQFSTVPHADIPRSTFNRSYSYKTTMNVNYLYPIFIDEALPGDSFKLDFTVFGRLINPLVRPVCDELYLETLWFQSPIRLLWTNWPKFCGEQNNPGDSTDFLIPVINSSTGFSNETIFDYFGLPTQVANYYANSLPLRMYNLVYNQWFRDENLINSVTVPTGDTDNASNYTLLKSAKQHDYFTSCLPFQQKGLGVEILQGNTPVSFGREIAPGQTPEQRGYSGATLYYGYNDLHGTGTSTMSNTTSGGVLEGNSPAGVRVAGLRLDDSFNVSDLRFAFQLQKYREKNARCGTRYTEYINGHFGVKSPDARLQRTEFLGSTRDMIDINTVVQTGGSSEPNGSLTAYGVVGNHRHGFTTSFTEHSYILGLCRIRHVPLYQQGLNRLWSRQTLFDFYDPLFACISEQPVLNKELVCQGNNVVDSDGNIIDNQGFGFQEAWADYRYHPNMITGKLRSNDSASLDVYHFAQYFVDSGGNPTVPKLNQSFIEEDIPIKRSISVANEPQFFLDFNYHLVCARPMPVHSVPGLVDHF